MSNYIFRSAVWCLFWLPFWSAAQQAATDESLLQQLETSLIEEEDSILLDIKFWTCGIVCDEANLSTLRTLQNYLTRHPLNSFQIENYTDCRGGDEENIRLSLQRSIEIRQWLVEEGVVKERLIAKGLGGRHPLSDCACSECTPLEHVQNRRVIFRLVNIFNREGLADRVVLEKPWLREKESYEGKVVMRICVDQQGKVSSAEIDEEETTATHTEYLKDALDIARDWRFTRSGREVQCGTITYDFGVE